MRTIVFHCSLYNLVLDKEMMRCLVIDLVEKSVIVQHFTNLVNPITQNLLSLLYLKSMFKGLVLNEAMQDFFSL